jgi:hypothetical protein
LFEIGGQLVFVGYSFVLQELQDGRALGVQSLKGWKQLIEYRLGRIWGWQRSEKSMHYERAPRLRGGTDGAACAHATLCRALLRYGGWKVNVR